MNLIDGWPGLACVGGHLTGAVALRNIPAARPDVVVVDLHLQDMSGIECISRLRPALPKTAFLVYSQRDEPEWILPALQAGARGYVIKGGPPSELLDAIASVHRGEFPFGQRVRGEILDYLRKNAPGSPVPPPLPQGDPASPPDFLLAAAANINLSRQEVVILEMISHDEVYKNIAATLAVSERTVNNRVAEILETLGAKSPAEAVRKYLAWKSRVPFPPCGSPRDPV
jgi:DNA-binding NarL/FixJ family response regulator